MIRRRFDEGLTDMMLKLRRWDKSEEKINALIPILRCSDSCKDLSAEKFRFADFLGEKHLPLDFSALHDIILYQE